MRKLFEGLKERVNPPKEQDTSVPLEGYFQSGFEQWFPEADIPPSPHHADVIFVHGLTGNRNDTWTHRLDAEPWPKIILPRIMPTSRLMTFGYDAYPARRGHRTSHNKLSDHAQKFVHELSALRRDDGTSSKPIVLIGHSMGGLLIKAVLRFADECGVQSHQHKILTCVAGIIFMGTPHKGSWHADWGSTPARLFRPFKDINMSLIQVLQTDDEYLQNLQESFSMLRNKLRKNGHDIATWVFYEELPLNLPLRMRSTMIVQPASAKLQEGQDIPIRKDHVEMTKFRAQATATVRKQPELHTLVNTIKTIIVDSLDSQQANIILSNDNIFRQAEDSRYVERLKASLHFNGMNHQFTRIEDPYIGTCLWIYEHPAYCAWIQSSNDRVGSQPSPLLLLRGPLGSGKSTLMRSMVKTGFSISKEYHFDLHIKFFLNPHTKALPRSIKGIWRAVIIQILKAYPEAATLDDSFETENASQIWDETQLYNFVLSIFRQQVLQGKRIVIALDAINECEDRKCHEIMSKLERVCTVARDSQVRLLILASSREENLPNTDSWRTIDVTLFNDVDIRNIVHVRLTGMLSDTEDETRALLEHSMLPKIAGNMLWMDIALSQLSTLHLTGHSVSSLLDSLQSFPPNLEPMYVASIEKLNEHEKSIGVLMASWLQAARRPLTLQELIFGVGLCMSNDNPQKCNDVETTIGASLEDFDAMERFLRHNSCALLRLRYRKKAHVVEFSHDSVRLFFLTTKGGLKALGVHDVDSFATLSHDTIAKAFERYCKMSEIQNSFLDNFGDQPSWSHYVSDSAMGMLRNVPPNKLPLARYFAQHGLHHVAESSWCPSTQLTYSDAFMLKGPELLKGWLFSVCFTTDDFEKSGHYDDAFWPDLVNQQSGLSFIARHSEALGLSDVQLNELVAGINNRSLFLRNLAKDRAEGSHIWAGQGDRYIQIFYVSSRVSKSVELTENVGSKLRDQNLLQSILSGPELSSQARTQVNAYQQICSQYAAAIAFVVVFQCESSFPVTGFRVANSAPITLWREQKPETPTSIPQLTSWRIETKASNIPPQVIVPQNDMSTQALLPLHARDDRGFISLLLCQVQPPDGSSEKPTCMALELSSQDEHQVFNDPENKRLEFSSLALSSLSGFVNPGSLTHIRLFLINEEQLEDDSSMPPSSTSKSNFQSDQQKSAGLINGDPQSQVALDDASDVKGDVPHWLQDLEQFMNDKVRRQDSYENEPIDDGIYPYDDHVSFASRHEDEFRVLRASRSVTSLSESLRGLDIEYQRHDPDSTSNTTREYTTRWIEEQVMPDENALNGAGRVLIDGNDLFTQTPMRLTEDS